jgi:hypothetical protein
MTTWSAQLPHSPRLRRRFLPPLLLALASGCSAMHQPLAEPTLGPSLERPPLEADHFLRDRSSVTEEALRQILDAPIGLDPGQRVGVVTVTSGYGPDCSLPLSSVTAELTRAIEGAGLFQATSEVSADWPSDSGLAGLRELAARYRSGYLLLYRQRFATQSYANNWAWLYPTVLGAIVAPSRTLETAGVLEASLFDVRTGTILFTVFERTQGSADETPWNSDRKMQLLQQRLLDQAATKLAEQVVAKTRRVSAASASPQKGVPSPQGS